MRLRSIDGREIGTETVGSAGRFDVGDGLCRQKAGGVGVLGVRDVEVFVLRGAVFGVGEEHADVHPEAREGCGEGFPEGLLGEDGGDVGSC